MTHCCIHTVIYSNGRACLAHLVHRLLLVELLPGSGCRGVKVVIVYVVSAAHVVVRLGEDDTCECMHEGI